MSGVESRQRAAYEILYAMKDDVQIRAITKLKTYIMSFTVNKAA